MHTSAEYIHELELQAKAPPDPVFGEFYRAFLDNLTEKDSVCNRFLVNIGTSRDLTPTHLVNILARATQYVMLYDRKVGNYPGNYSQEANWAKELPVLFGFGPGTYGAEIETLIINRHTSTTIYNRYAGPEFVLRQINGEKPVSVVDFGCGRNYLRAWELEIPYNPITDRTEGIFTKTMERRVNLGSGLSIDLFDPSSEDSILWARACLYPRELNTVPQIEDFERKLKESKRVHFQAYDLLRPNGVSIEGNKDAVILATFLYQFSRGQQNQILDRAESLLKENGVVVVADFAQIASTDTKTLDFIGNWHGAPWPYGIFVRGKLTSGIFLEVLRASSGRVREISPGRDLDNFLDLTRNNPIGNPHWPVYKSAWDKD